MPAKLEADERGRRFRLSPSGTYETQCSRCHQIDDHPKHGIGVIPGSGEPASFHKDCHAALGCPVCLHDLERVEHDGEKGDDLRALFVAAGPIPAEKVAELLGQPLPGQEG